MLFLCQKMQRLDLYGTVDTVFCALDSINHLSGPEQVLETFKRVAFFLNDDGWFIFDVNTPFKHEKVLADNTFVYDLPDIYCVWQNTYNPQDGSVAIELDFFERQGKLYARSSERFPSAPTVRKSSRRCCGKRGLTVSRFSAICASTRPRPTSSA